MQGRSAFRMGLAASALALSCAGCISFEKTANYDYKFDERFRKSTQEIVERSGRAEKVALANGPAQVRPETAEFLQRHFARADELVMAHMAKQGGGRTHFFGFDEYSRRRAALLDFTLKLQPSLVLVDAKTAGALAFPSGKVFVYRPLAEGFVATPDGFDSVLLGILVHELIHVRDGHALEQWGTADSRKAWSSDQFLEGLSGITAVIPFLSVKYDIQYPLTYGAAKQLPSLSEFAADFGAVTLLDGAGYDSSRYVAFLADSSEASRIEGARKNPPTLLQQRVACLRQLSAERFESDVSSISVGSYEAGDQLVLTLDVKAQLAAAPLLDSPELLAKAYPGKPGLSDADRRRVVLDGMRKMAFLSCAIRASFPDIPLKDGVLNTPTFAPSMFVQYL
jgi:hypothetical protein